MSIYEIRKFLKSLLKFHNTMRCHNHHFCYIEAFIMMMHDTLGTPIGPRDPRDRTPVYKTNYMGSDS